MSFLLLNMRLIEARSPAFRLCDTESFDGVDDMLLIDRDGPSEVLSVKRETCTGCDELVFLPCNKSVPLLLAARIGVACGFSKGRSISGPLCT